MDKITQGSRRPDNTQYAGLLPGDYCRETWREGGFWLASDPSGTLGSINPKVHTITEHEDGSISLSPSFVGLSGWHGFLRGGIWSEC